MSNRYAIASSFLLATVSACAADSDETATDQQDLVGGTDTTLRPEIGQLGINGLGCTGTLVTPNIVLTAAHCVAYSDSNVAGIFQITSKSGVVKNFAVDKTFALGPGNPLDLSSGVGSTDVALVHLATLVASSDADPTYIWPSWPGVGTLQTAFGFGCQARGTSLGAGVKQYVQFIAGETTQDLCPGDSGGPLVWYGATQGGPVFAVNSGYDTGDGHDIFGDAGFHGPPGVEAVKRFWNAYTTNATETDLAYWSTLPGVKAVSGDFDGDGVTDIALLGGSGWATLPVAFGNGDGSYRVTNYAVGDLGTWAQQATQAVAGDFDGDGKTDIALAGGPGWITIPIAFSNGDGTFRTTNQYSTDFASWAHSYGAQLLATDLDGDGRSDLVLTGGSGWSTIPVATSYGDGNFHVYNATNAQFASWASTGLGTSYPVHAVSGHFDGTTKPGGIALVGGYGWGSIPVATYAGAGTFTVTNQQVAHVGAWGNQNAKVVAADFDGDGKTDIALTGGTSWITIAFALSAGGGYFTPANLPIASFPVWSGQARFALAGSFRNRRHNIIAGSDIALLGGNGWWTTPVAFVGP